MSLANPSLNEDARAESILAKLDAAEQAAGATVAQPEPAPIETPVEAPVVETAETAPEEIPASVESQGHTEPVKPAIEPPATWKAELKDRWTKLPEDLQRDLAQWETERNTGVSQRLEKATAAERAADTAKQAADAQAAAAVQEQQRYAQQLAAVAQQMEANDPVISAYRNTDLVKLSQENPAQYTQLHASYNQRVSQLQGIRAEQQRVHQEATRTWLQREQTALIAAVPEWSDATKRQADLAEMRNAMASSYGYKPEEIEAVADHRHVRVLRDAMEVSKLRTEIAALKAEKAEKDKISQAAIAAKRVATPAPVRTLRPGAASDNTDKVESDRSKAIVKQAKGARSLHDKAEILSRL